MADQQAPQMTPEQFFQYTLNLFQFVNLAEVVHLSENKSVNLRYVAKYESVDLVIDQVIEGHKHKTETIPDVDENGKQKTAPALFYGSNDEGDVLTPEENEIFRKHWQRHAYLTGKLYEVIDSLFGIAVTAPPPAAVEEVLS